MPEDILGQNSLSRSQRAKIESRRRARKATRKAVREAAKEERKLERAEEKKNLRWMNMLETRFQMNEEEYVSMVIRKRVFEY